MIDSKKPMEVVDKTLVPGHQGELDVKQQDVVKMLIKDKGGRKRRLVLEDDDLVVQSGVDVITLKHVPSQVGSTKENILVDSKKSVDKITKTVDEKRVVLGDPDKENLVCEDEEEETTGCEVVHGSTKEKTLVSMKKMDKVSKTVEDRKQVDQSKQKVESKGNNVGKVESKDKSCQTLVDHVDEPTIKKTIVDVVPENKVIAQSRAVHSRWCYYSFACCSSCW